MGSLGLVCAESVRGWGWRGGRFVCGVLEGMVGVVVDYYSEEELT